MPGPYYAITTQKRKRYFSVNPLGNRLGITNSGECWQVRIIALHLYPDTPGTGSSQKPRHCSRMNIEKSGGVSASFSARQYHRNDFILLIGSELWTTTSDAAALAGGIQSSLCSLAEYCSFELGKCSDHLRHHASRGRCRINRFCQTPESCFSFLNPFHNHQHVPKRSRKSIKSPDYEYIVLPQLIQQAVQLGPPDAFSRKIF